LAINIFFPPPFFSWLKTKTGSLEPVLVLYMNFFINLLTPKPAV